MPQLEIAHRGTFDTMVRNKNETFANFGNRLLDQSKLAYPKMSENDRDDLCALRFSRVMQNEDPILHKFLVTGGKSQSLFEIIGTAVQYTAGEKPIASGNTRTNVFQVQNTGVVSNLPGGSANEIANPNQAITHSAVAPRSILKRPGAGGCFICGDPGHMKARCPFRDDKRGLKCAICHRTGHASVNCFKNGNNRPSPPVSICQICLTEGHTAMNCNLWPGNEYYAGNEVGAQGNQSGQWGQGYTTGARNIQDNQIGAEGNAPIATSSNSVAKNVAFDMTKNTLNWA